MARLAALLRRTHRAPAPEPRVHDWTQRNYTGFPRDGGQELGIVFWGDDVGGVPRVGDYLILRNGEETTRYRLTAVDKHLAEGDVYSADAVFAPRSEVPRG